MIPSWLTWLSTAMLVVGLLSAAEIAVDISVRGYRQPMRIMEAVWPVTGLYFGPAASWAYRSFGRPKSPQWQHERGLRGPQPEPDWAPVALGVTHCGAGCTLGDIIAEFAVFGVGATVAGEPLYAEYAGDYLAALGLGIAFQYLAIASMRNLSVRAGLSTAAKADVLSLTSFEVGLFDWMGLVYFVLWPAPHHLTPSAPTYWFLMQVGMVIGYFTAWPTNVWLIRRGIKEGM
ncbi:MAG TPA: DUF4396 domain-containing protein [Mycobacteriales bacterium]|nr:DUF4396 domain-containing protein [Mycobacteriales bacterium]